MQTQSITHEEKRTKETNQKVKERQSKRWCSRPGLLGFAPCALVVVKGRPQAEAVLYRGGVGGVFGIAVNSLQGVSHPV